MKTTAQILNAKYPCDIFSAKDETKIKKEYKALLMNFHPDLSGNKGIKKSVANECTIIINDLYNKIKDNFDSWDDKTVIMFQAEITNKKYKIKTLYEDTFVMGRYYITENNLVYVIDGKYKKFYDNFIDSINKIKFPSISTEESYKNFLPEIKYNFKDIDGNYIIILKKHGEIYPLRKVLNYFGGSLNERHIAWVLSRLYDFTCLMKYNNLSFNGIDIDNLFIDTENHTLRFYGMFYIKEIDEKLIGVPKSVLPLLNKDKISDIKTDLQSIRLISRLLYNDEYGSKIFMSSTLPSPLKKWMMTDASGDPVKEYENWDKCIVDSFGPKKFFTLKIEKNKILTR